MRPARAYIGIGSNLGRPLIQMRHAFLALRKLPASHCMACSPLYRGAPVGGPSGQPDYLNAAAALDTTLAPDELLTALQAIEAAQGRTRTVHWGPRTLDLDLLLYDQLVLDGPRLTLPHPRLHERAFVLYPLYDIAPDLEIPGRGLLSELLIKFPQTALVRLDSAE
ncbi:MAG: 2-amino-4-hydroxy-6-hydroxymethyldihydropteridine diphosphokinase [Candidatus Competibacteraceae bacterium]|nr:MAG: 2-amino-4-hydroxy-6-hydroxymethyldihydropteridine diphosphokinase [Candidatus Competibacteraceae bacterium]